MWKNKEINDCESWRLMKANNKINKSSLNLLTNIWPCKEQAKFISANVYYIYKEFHLMLKKQRCLSTDFLTSVHKWESVYSPIDYTT